MGHRADLNALTKTDQATLASLMLLHLQKAGVISAHDPAWHGSGTRSFFEVHRSYIAGMERTLAESGGKRFVPLPMWRPTNPIPDDFMVVLGSRQPLVNQNPAVPVPAEFEYPAVCANFDSPDELATQVESWHNGVHGVVGGSMASLVNAPAAPIFWCWHAFIDDIYWNWNCRLASEQANDIDYSITEIKAVTGTVRGILRERIWDTWVDRLNIVVPAGQTITRTVYVNSSVYDGDHKLVMIREGSWPIEFYFWLWGYDPAPFK